MPAPSPSQATKAGAVVAFLAVVGAIMVGTLHPSPGTDRRSTKVPWGESGKPADVECMWTSAVSSPESRALFGMDADGGAQYVQVRICAAPLDGGMPDLPSGMDALDVTQELTDGGDYHIEAWSQGAAEFPCACSTGSNCERLLPDETWAPALRQTTMQPGTFRGAGCFKKTCVERFGTPSMPTECPP